MSAEALILVTTSGRINAATPSARRWLREYFPLDRQAKQLPSELCTWLTRQARTTARQLPFSVTKDKSQLRAKLLRAETDGAFCLLLERHEGSPPPSRRSTLTPKELQVLRAVAKGGSNKQVATALHGEVATIKKHLEHIYKKLGVGTRTAALARARHLF
jgi:ATP/maltotriose-dependent transcriptional regulator MalT